MKHTLLVLIALMGMSFISNAQQHALVLQNNTRRDILASFVYYDNTQQCWVSRGWRKIASYGTNAIDLDGLNIGSTVMYVYAHNLFKEWKGNFFFCCNDGQQMRILYADQANCGNKKGYNQVNTGDGQTLYTFNP